MYGRLEKRIKQIPLIVMSLLLFLTMTACENIPAGMDSAQKHNSGQIYLYGEIHAEEKIKEKEADLWYEYYHNKGLRHLFIEAPYYTAEFLNLWMRSDNDDILEAVYDAWEGSAAHNPYLKAFYQRIKQECPETIFHGTDVGHQYDTTGKQFLDYLQANHLEDSEQYQIAQEAIEQGKYFYDHLADVYRENKMVENFIREFDALDGESSMGVYGGAHTGINEKDYSTHSIPNMATQLYAIYGDALHSEDLIWIAKDINPERMDTITVAGKAYEAAYFGKEDIRGFNDYEYREFWRLENAYDDFKKSTTTGSVLPYENFPMLIEPGQVFVVDFTKTDGSVSRMYFRADGNKWQGRLTTEEFTVQK